MYTTKCILSFVTVKIHINKVYYHLLMSDNILNTIRYKAK